MKAGPRNSICDIAGLRVGNASDAALKSGVTALICDGDNVASCHVMGGAPGTRDTDLLAPENIVRSVDALVLSGGSAFGLDAAGGVQSHLRDIGRGFEVAGQRVPIVPAAILFDLVNGGDKDWGTDSPYRELGREAAAAASHDFDIGTVGAGTGALTGGPYPGLKGGLGTASTQLDNGVIVAALVAVTALGSPVMGRSGTFWAQPFALGDELGASRPVPPAHEAQELQIKFRGQTEAGANTTIGIIATNATLSKAEVKRLAIAAHDGFARALWPAHTPLDGDLIFGLATCSKATPSLEGTIDLSAYAASTMSRAIARGVHAARSVDDDLFPTWQDRFGNARA